jgi:excisionase family DNA binding protein
VTIRRTTANTRPHEYAGADARGTVLLTPANAAALAQVSKDTIYREIDRGVLPVLHVGRLLRIDPVDFTHYLARGSER